MAMGQFVDELVVSCVDSARSHAQVLCKAGEECMTVRSSPSRYNVKKLRHHFDPTRGDQVRLLIVHQLELIVQSWKKTDLDLHYQDITSVLAKALHDKNDQIRAIARGVFCLVCSIWCILSLGTDALDVLHREEHLDDLVDLPMSFEITTEPADDDNAPFASIEEVSDICNMSQAVDSTRHLASDTTLTYSIADATPKSESVSCPLTTNKEEHLDDLVDLPISFEITTGYKEEHLDDLVDLPMSFEITTEPADDNAPFTSIAEASDICNMSQAVDSTRHIASDTALTYSIADATPKRESVSCPRTTNKSTMSGVSRSVVRFD
ncbi:unnamed protein product [Aphanomyces euteiches]